jgi:hypothetical protein
VYPAAVKWQADTEGLAVPRPYQGSGTLAVCLHTRLACKGFGSKGSGRMQERERDRSMVHAIDESGRLVAKRVQSIGRAY